MQEVHANGQDIELFPQSGGEAVGHFLQPCSVLGGCHHGVTAGCAGFQPTQVGRRETVVVGKGKHLKGATLPSQVFLEWAGPRDARQGK